MKVYGHRGAPDTALENTMASFEAACKLNCFAFELDVHKTKDNKIAVIHTTYELKEKWGNDKSFTDLTLEELKSLEFTDPSGKYGVQRIPDLDEVYEMAKKYPDVMIIVDIKDQCNSDDLYENLVKTTKKHNMNRRVRYSFTGGEVLSWFAKNAPEEPVALTPNDLDDTDFERGLKYGCKMVATHPYFRVVDKEYVDRAHKAGLEVVPWTVDDPNEVKRLMDIGVDGILTNRPTMAFETIEKNK